MMFLPSRSVCVLIRLLAWVPLVLVLSCVKPPPAAQKPSGEGESSVPGALGPRPQAVLEPGEGPLWFECGPAGPVWINSPGEASLAEFRPWPLARYVSGMLVRDGRLILAVNRDGFLGFLPGQPDAPAGSLSMYRSAEPLRWEDYTIAAFFEFRGIPAALLYRDDFFVDSGAALPRTRVWGFEAEEALPVELSIPAFAPLSAGDGWDIETLRQGRDGLWYYRGVKKDIPQREIRYLRTADLAVAGEFCSTGVFRNAAVPYTKDKAPFVLHLALEEAERRYGGEGTRVAAVVSPDFPAVRYFSAEDSAPEDGGEGSFTEIAGYYRESAAAGSPGVTAPGAVALLIFPDGRGVVAGGEDTASRPGLFSLPPLPEGFVYTRLGLAGTALVAAWEEQDGWNVGAAGFLVIAGPE